MFEIFNASKKVDMLLVTMDYSLYSRFLQKQYAYEQTNNDRINSAYRENPNDQELYNKKMESDLLLNKISYDIFVQFGIGQI